MPSESPSMTPSFRECVFDTDCIGVIEDDDSGCPLCTDDGECIRGCREDIKDPLSPSSACCRLPGSSGNINCASSCGNNVCLQNPALNWENATNQQAVCQAQPQFWVCNEECEFGCTSPLDPMGGRVFANFTHLTDCTDIFRNVTAAVSDETSDNDSIDMDIDSSLSG